MSAGKVAVGVGLLAVVAAAAVALVALDASLLAAERGARDGSRGEIQLTVILPDGTPLFNGTVVAENATALSVLLAAAAHAGFDVELEEHALGTYVRGIGGHRASGPDGWKYYVQRDGAWKAGDRTSADFAVARGEAVLWRWSDAGSVGAWG